jgi:hypothetical protein
MMNHGYRNIIVVVGKVIFFIIVCLMICNHIYCQDVTISAKVSDSVFTLGDKVVLTLSLTSKTAVEATFQVLPKNWGKLEIQTIEPNRVIKESHNYCIYKQIALSAYDTGTFMIPSLSVTYHTIGSNLLTTLQSEQISIRVTAPSVDLSKDIKDIDTIESENNAVTQPFFSLAIFIKAAVVLAIVILIIYIFRKSKKKSMDFIPLTKIEIAKNTLNEFVMLYEAIDKDTLCGQIEGMDYLLRLFVDKVNLFSSDSMTDSEFADTLTGIEILNVTAESAIRYSEIVTQAKYSDRSKCNEADYIDVYSFAKNIIENYIKFHESERKN